LREERVAMTWIRRKLLWLAAGALVAGAGCATTGPSAVERLEDRRLMKRAAFDLDCPTEPMSIVRIDEKTRGVRGCGRQATYVKLCDAPVDNVMRSCVWVMNSGNRSAF
jgi:hypothetical protein